MEEAGGIVVSRHHLTVPIVDNHWRGKVLNLHPYPISRGQWFLRPTYISSDNYGTDTQQKPDFGEFGLKGSAENFLIRLVCDRALASDTSEKLSLACFTYKSLTSEPLIFRESFRPLTDCEDKLVLRLQNFDKDGNENDCTAKLISILGGKLELGIELVQVKPRHA